MRRPVRHATRMGRLLFAVLLVLGVLPPGSPPPVAKAAPATQLPTQAEPMPETRTVPPSSPDTTPSLHLTLTPLPKILMVGDSVPVEIVVTNEDTVPATDVVVTLPLPAGTQAAPGAPLTWQRATLGAGATFTSTTTLVVTAAPAGDALLLIPELIASNLPQPVRAREGTLVRAATRTIESKRTFTPGKTSTVASPDGRQRVTLPGAASKRALTITVRPDRHRTILADKTALKATTTITPPVTAGFYRGFETFALEASDSQGNAVHTFDAPITITVQYTPEELDALHITEDNLTIFWFDATGGTWVPQLTTIDRTAHTATIVVNHFSEYQLSDGSSPSEAYLPSVQNWQVSLFTGSASYQYPIDVPSGPAGIRPEVSLTYNSSATDASTRSKDQASWVGKGWSFEPSSIARNKISNSTTNYFSLVLNGQSLDLVRAEPLISSPIEGKLSHWAWRPTDENFIKARVTEISSQLGRGGTKSLTPYQRYKWQIWNKDGTLYEFSEDLWWGYQLCTSNILNDYAYLETYKWQLSSITDVHSNTISYNYNREIKPVTSNCFQVSGTIDRDIWPASITWGKNTSTGSTDRYKVAFDVITRTNDLAFEAAINHIGGDNGTPRESQQLTAIRVLSKQQSASDWELVRKYALTYDYSLYSDNSLNSNGVYSANTAYPKLTLKSIQRLGKDGTTALPATTFTYGTTRGSGLYPNGDWNRLITSSNGQGGTTTFTYQTIGGALTPQDGKFVNYRRVTQKSQTDGQGNTYTWNYAYTSPALNSLGTRYNSQSTQAEPNSAALYFNMYRYPNSDNSSKLARRPFKEFRGHASVVETNPQGNQTEHYFYQGDIPTATCILAASGGGPVEGSAIETNACFQFIRSREFLKGREYRTVQRGGMGSAKLYEVTHLFHSVHPSTQTENSVDMGNEPLSGLWRAFNYPRESLETFWEGGTTPTTKRTISTYNASYQANGVFYGNPTQIEEYTTPYNQSQTLLRKVVTQFETLTTDKRYIVDRVRATTIYSGTGEVLGQTINMYDGRTTQFGLVDKGDPTLTRTYYDIPQQANQTNVTTHSHDTSFGYDAYGNATSHIRYAGPGTKYFNGTSSSFSSPGNGSTAYTTTTTFDSVFHAFPVTSTPPFVNVDLSESAVYDYRMGTMTQTTDANGVATDAVYDVFGRMTKLINSGDTEAIPTAQLIYADWEQPYRFVVYLREQSGVSSAYRGIRRFYDGMGREIQTKHETINDAQNSVVDRRYNGLGQLTWQTLPRSVNETPGTTFYYYSPLPTTGIVSTTTTFDPLGRPLDTTGPDGTVTSTRYWWSTDGVAATVTDPKAHKTRRESDVFGRLARVIEYSGNGGSEGSYAVYGTTHYTHDPKDQLTLSIDAAGNRTRMTYDSAGRKLAMVDPDMGSWSYTYDVAGNRLTQTDAKGQTITWTYDILGREKTKSYPNAGGTVYFYYDENDIDPRYGAGRRTSMTDLTGGKSWHYDAAGNITRENQTVVHNGVSTFYSTYFGYNTNGTLNTLTYPTGETLTYNYNNAWQQVGIATSLGGSYLTAATYNAQGQTLTQTFGNGVVATNTYDTRTNRLNVLQIQGTGGSTYQRTYNYDLAGNIQTVASNTETIRYTYDHRDRLTSACTWVGGICTTGGGNFNESYGYDAIGNLTIKAGTNYTYQSSRPHAVTSVGGASYAYDANGNLQTGGGRTYTWNVENLPTQIVNGSTTETYTYDGLGTRVTKTTTTGGNTTRTVYVGAGFVEYTGTTEITNYGIAFRTKVGSSSNIVTYHHGDRLGSTSTTSGASGVLSSPQEFTPWGAVRSGSITTTELNYTGQRRDSGTGLLYYNARYYDPQLGRFLSADTIIPDAASPQSRNRYSYTLNNPLRYTDPSGHCSKELGADVEEQTECKVAKEELARYGLNVPHLDTWRLYELELIIQAIRDMLWALRWTPQAFKDALTGFGRLSVNLYRIHTDTGPRGEAASTCCPDPQGNRKSTNITFYDSAFWVNDGAGGKIYPDPRRWSLPMIVHEFAHAWDQASYNTPQKRLKQRTAGITETACKYGSCKTLEGGWRASSKAYHEDPAKDPGEDWAESVAAVVYPEHFWSDTPVDSPGKLARLNAVSYEASVIRNARKR